MTSTGHSAGDSAQVRLIAEAIAEATIIKFENARGSPPKADLPPPLKWAGGIVAGLMATGVAAMAFWLVTTVNDMQVTLARVDERMNGELDELSWRVSRLESYQQAEDAK